MARPLSGPSALLLLSLLLLLAALPSPACASEEDAVGGAASTPPARRPTTTTDYNDSADDERNVEKMTDLERVDAYYKEFTEYKPAEYTIEPQNDKALWKESEMHFFQQAHAQAVESLLLNYQALIINVLDQDLTEPFHLRAGKQSAGDSYDQIDDGILRHHQEQLIMAMQTEGRRYRIFPLTLAISRYYLALVPVNDKQTRLMVTRHVWAQLQLYPCRRWNMTISPLGSLPTCSQFGKGEEESVPGLNQTRLRLPLIALITLTDKLRGGDVRVSRHLDESFANDETKIFTTTRNDFIYDYHNDTDHPYTREFAHYAALLTPEKADAAFIERAARFLDRLKNMSTSVLPEWLDRFEAAAPPPETSPGVWDKITGWFSSSRPSNYSTNSTATTAATAAATALFGGMLAVFGLIMYRLYH